MNLFFWLNLSLAFRYRQNLERLSFLADSSDWLGHQSYRHFFQARTNVAQSDQ